MPREAPKFRSHGDGSFRLDQFRSLGASVIFEAGVMVWHPENISIGTNVYVGHSAMLKGYWRNTMEIGDNTWIGQQVFIHSAGGVRIGANVGIGPGVKILTSQHAEEGIDTPILFSRVDSAPVVIEDDCDIGVGSIILPGITLGRGTQVGAGAVVTRDVPAYSVVAGVPAKIMRMRPGIPE